jgi:hypothetical protein
MNWTYSGVRTKRVVFLERRTVVYGGRIEVGAAGIAVWTGRITVWDGPWPREIIFRVLDYAYSGMNWTCGSVDWACMVLDLTHRGVDWKCRVLY